ncbi:phage terminase, small subunit, putative, P27 family [Nitrosomonas ureae]|uniref:Phage terminase, small subunit, putative, P27 family n=1 Tax=Nitrosomonas ureae TaxID=44577 RepID=A0A285BWZ5_9PROT|nr:phage terminase small subunit P27 family [Nitrosomonas ureae]SNX59739.1 phage terminase, small subunit, putative, P27 family [Nitrosomonas ureae]
MKPGPVPKKNNVTELKTVGDNKPKYLAPECPAHVTGAAKQEWLRIILLLEKYKLITDIDTAALALYCVAYGRWQEAEKRIRENKADGGDGMIITSPNGYPIQNPYLIVANRAMEDCYKYLQQFGLSPAARTRVTPGLQGDLFASDEPGKNYLT